MKNIILLLLLASNVSLASDYSNILYYRGRSLGRDVREQITETKKILDLVQIETDRLGIQVSRKNLKDNLGNTYPAFVVSTSGSHPVNREALRVSKLMGGVPLVFSPYDLGRSKANAFYDPQGTMIGVSYHFILGRTNDQSYVHELYHANTYAQVVQGKEMMWAGIKKLLKGSAISASNTNYYFRFASLDELPATALSVQLSTQEILELKRVSSPAEFNKSRGEAEGILGDLLMSVNAGLALAKQVQDVASKALNSNYKVQNEQLAIGSLRRNVQAIIFSLSSHDRVFANGRGTNVDIPEGVEFKMYSASSVSPQNLKRRLTQIINQAKLSEQGFNEVKKCIYVLIEYPDVAKTDYRCLENTGNRPFSVF